MKTVVTIGLLTCFIAGGEPPTNPHFPPLDPPYPVQSPGRIEVFGARSKPSVRANLPPSKSDFEKAFANQSPVKSQGVRGTCSMFSSTALLESNAIRVLREKNIDLSEEFFEYLVIRNRAKGGSSSFINLKFLQMYGLPDEDTMKYNPDIWTELGEEWEPSSQRCRKVPAHLLESCLRVHWDPRLLTVSKKELLDPKSDFYFPEFEKARTEATANRALLFRRPRTISFSSINEVKLYLAQGGSVLVDLPFYYGAWNHGKADVLGIGRDAAAFIAGRVGYPEVGSADREKSPKEPAGHSVLIVGYDDEREIETKIKMADGSLKTFKYKGVFYFKNSWGTDAFGVKLEVGGKAYPGYGAITQKYASEYGSFFSLSL